MATTPTSPTSPVQHAMSGTGSLGGGTSPPLSRSSTFSRTIPLPDKTVHVVRNPTEGYKLRDVEWVIQGSREHVPIHQPFVSKATRLIVVGVPERVSEHTGFEEE